MGKRVPVARLAPRRDACTSTFLDDRGGEHSECGPTGELNNFCHVNDDPRRDRSCQSIGYIPSLHDDASFLWSTSLSIIVPTMAGCSTASGRAVLRCCMRSERRSLIVSRSQTGAAWAADAKQKLEALAKGTPRLGVWSRRFLTGSSAFLLLVVNEAKNLPCGAS